MATSATLTVAADHQVPRAKSPAPRLLRLAAVVVRMGDWLFGVATLIVGLSILATIPVVQLLSLGYLIEVSGRVAREQRVRAGFVGVRQAARLGRMALGITILLIPLWIVSSLAESAHWIAIDSRTAKGWRAALILLTVLVALQIGAACLRGGKLRHFLWPRPLHSLRLALAPGAYGRARDAVWEFVVGLHLPAYFWLGLQGLMGAVAWLVVPVSMLAASSRLPGGGGALLGLAGGALLAMVVLQLPFLQAQLGESHRLAAMFEVRTLRQRFSRAPIAFFIALVVTLVLAVPLYLLKIEIVPREAAWLPSLLFVVSIFPARLLTGWALARSSRHSVPRLWLFRWGSRAAMLGVALVYVLVAYFTQYLSWYGVWSLYEQHAFLVPAPFLDW